MKKLFATILFSSVVLAGCSAGSQTAATPTSTSSAPTTQSDATAQNHIEIKNFAFNPGTLTVKAGSTVTVTNRDGVMHNVHAADDSFKTKLLNQDETVSFTAPSKAGTYPFVCDPHASRMKGTLIVE